MKKIWNGILTHRYFVFAVMLAFALAGCQTDGAGVPKPEVQIAGPKFAASEFQCGTEPAPPGEPLSLDPKHQASKISHYVNRESAWGNGCANKLHAAGQKLDAAGQIVR